ncbi:hypothetical protein A2U01_0101540, partial [Trifolium medium]|nr:hypothetical protein [Trifolium medium]
DRDVGKRGERRKRIITDNGSIHVTGMAEGVPSHRGTAVHVWKETTETEPIRLLIDHL